MKTLKKLLHVSLMAAALVASPLSTAPHFGPLPPPPVECDTGYHQEEVCFLFYCWTITVCNDK